MDNFLSLKLAQIKSNKFYHPFWINVPSAKSDFYTVDDRSKGFGGNPPTKSKLFTPLTVAIWL